MCKKKQNYMTPRTLFIESLVYGSTLAGAYISPQGSARFHQAAHHKEYVEWLYHQLVPVCTTSGPKDVQSRRYEKVYSSVRFNTRSCFKDFREAFYGDTGTKRLPLFFEDRLNPTILAAWYMDAGSRIYSARPGRGAFLHITGYTKEEGVRIQKALFNTFGLSSVIHRGKDKNNTYQRLCFIATSYQHLYTLISPMISQVETIHLKKLPFPIQSSRPPCEIHFPFSDR